MFKFAANCSKSTANSLGLVKMDRYTLEQRVFINKQYLKNNDNGNMVGVVI